jgi:hypothetical protein
MNRTIARRAFLKASAYAILAAPLAAGGAASGEDSADWLSVLWYSDR